MNFLVNVNLNQNELQNVVIQPLAVAPSNPKTGQIYYNTTNSVLYSFDGTQWSAVGTTYVLPPATTTTLGGVIVGTGLSVDANGNLTLDTIEWSDIDNTPTTIAGYAITDAKIENGVITLGSATITPVVDANYVHTDNNFTTALKDKLEAIEAGAEVNVIESISVNGTTQTVDSNKNVNLAVLPLTGGTMSGAIAMGSNKITDLGTPTANTDAATKKYVDDSISSLGTLLNFKGTVATTSALPTTGMSKGDVYIVTADNSEWVWTSDSATGSASDYEQFGPTIDLSGYLQIADLASGTGSSTTTAMTQAAVTAALDGLIKTATGTIGTSATSATVAYTGTCIGTRTTMSNAEVVTEVTVNSANVVFTCATAPSAAVTCTVFYV